MAGIKVFHTNYYGTGVSKKQAIFSQIEILLDFHKKGLLYGILVVLSLARQ